MSGASSKTRGSTTTISRDSVYPAADAIHLAEGDQRQERASPAWRSSRRWSPRPRRPCNNPPRCSSRRPSARTAAPSPSTRRGLFELAGETPQLSELRAAAKPVVAALKDYQKFLEERSAAAGQGRLAHRQGEVLPQARPGTGRRPDRGRRCCTRPRPSSTASSARCTSSPGSCGAGRFPGKALPPDDAEGRRETIRLVLADFNQEHGKPEDLVTRRPRQRWQRIKTFITDNDILRLPDPDRCQVDRDAGVPARQLGGLSEPGPAARPAGRQLSTPSARRRATGTTARWKATWKNTTATCCRSSPSTRRIRGITCSWNTRNRHPSLIRKVLSSGVFAEGWAVYTEQMMLDQGYGKGDLALRLNQLKWYLRAVANAILDHKMHCDGMTDEEAMDVPDAAGASSRRARRWARSSGRSRVRVSSRPTSSAGRRSTGCGSRSSASRATSSTWAATTRRCWTTARCR